ncbi:Zinc finger protein Dzip1 [Liparis tanakae]|uniref:Zinc finger protein Dzip1 n=1 Tax=Liparis tanakae TaxID=230148 RepID=A0A4Z2H9G6_9TELE|nr:Zinc finger protein Dzip1 [Liparis tanakae]
MKRALRRFPPLLSIAQLRPALSCPLAECGDQRLRHPQIAWGPEDRKLFPKAVNSEHKPSGTRVSRPHGSAARGRNRRAATGLRSLPARRGEIGREMPFHDGAYYPYVGDTQGTHSSAGIPSLLNSPLSGMTPSSAAVAPFKFRPRRESVDWRRIGAVDVDLVVSQLDLDALQEHIGGVTFCSLDGERCQRCQSPVDPALVKLLRLAQLTVEWLLHCQEFLAHSVRAVEERAAAAGRERERLLGQQKKQEETVKALAAELKQRKKVIRTQQAMLTPRVVSGQKCPHCDKSFLNSSFLQNHMQRRHPGEYDTESRSDSEKRSRMESLKSEISGLKEQVVQQQLDLQAKTAQEKEQQSVHKDLLRELDRFKAEEMARMDRKIEDSRDGMRREMEFLYTRNIQALNEANQNQTAKHEKPSSPVYSQPERDLDNYKEMQTQAMQKMEHQLKKQVRGVERRRRFGTTHEGMTSFFERNDILLQDKKWGSRLQEIQEQHESEKNRLLNELSRMQSSVSDHQESSQRLQQDMSRRLQEREHTIQTQREQIRNISSTPPTKIVEVPMMVSAPAPEPKPKRVVLEEPVSAPKLDPIQELSEEEKDSSGFSERRPAERRPPEPAPEKKPRATAGALKRNPNIKREMRPDLEQAVVEKLESLGVKSDQSGLKERELSSLLAKVHSKRESVAKALPDYWRRREEIAGAVEQKLDGQGRGSEPAAESQARARPSVLQIRPRSSSLPSRAPRVASGAAVKQPKTPQPVPRTRTAAKPKTSTPKSAPRTFTTRTPPFSSGEESDDVDTDVEEERRHQKHQRGKSPQPRLSQVQTGASRAGPVQSGPARGPQAFASNPPQVWGGSAVAKMESDEDEWSQVSELQEVDPKRLQNFKDQNGNVDKRNFGKGKWSSLPTQRLPGSENTRIHRDMKAGSVAERAAKKPAGGVSVFPERKDEVQELTYTDLEESSEWEAAKPAPGHGAARKSLESPSTSVWGTSTGKGAKSGLTGGGTGSTLKSSLCSLSDISDSEDTSNK